MVEMAWKQQYEIESVACTVIAEDLESCIR